MAQNLFKSVYGRDCLDVLKRAGVGPFNVYEEVVACGDDGVTLLVAYAADGAYIGNSERAIFLNDLGVTERLQPVDGGLTCTVGFNPAEQKWYVWTHRGFCSFGVGSSVSQGDVAFRPSCPEEVEASMLKFWDLTNPYVWRECENEKIVCKNRLFRSVQTVQDGQLGWLVAYDTIFIGADRHFVREYFRPFPKVWGRGAWVAETLDDAKQMALDFSKGGR